MRFPVRWIVSIAAGAALAASVGLSAQSSSSTAPADSTPAKAAPQITPGQSAAANGAYISVDPLASVRYDNRYDVSLGLAYDHMKAGPTLLQGSNLGGLDVNGSYWLTKRWGIEGSERTYVGTSGTGPNAIPTGGTLKGPFVSEYFFVGGPEWLGPHNKHGDLIAHFMVGGVYGNFQKDLLGFSPAIFDFYNNQLALAAIVGGHMDLNRSEHVVFRITPDAVMTHYGINYAPKTSQFDVNFAISVGIEYKFTKSKRKVSGQPYGW
jgi:hypothetical protein